MNNCQLNNSINYSGVVNIKLKTNDKIYNFGTCNTGLAYLWQTITMALAGLNIHKRLPKYLDLKYRVSQGEDPEIRTTLLYQKIPFTGISYGLIAGANDQQDCLLLNAVISSYNLKEINIDNTEGLALEILSFEGQPMAEVVVDTGAEDTLLIDLYKILRQNPNNDALIEWKIIIENKVKE